MEELITTVIVLSFNFALDVRDTLGHQSRTAAYYEIEQSDSTAEVGSLSQYHVQNKGGTRTTAKRVFHRSTKAAGRAS